MKMHTSFKRMPACFMAAILPALGLVTTAQQLAAQALEGRIVVRPLTPQELKDPSLVGKQGASGMSTVGVGQPAYLDAVVNIAIDRTNIAGVDWNLSKKPLGSVAVLTNSHLGANIPIYNVGDRESSQVARPNGRQVLIPDVAGQYTVSATITTTDGVTTNLTQNITAGTYLGAYTCALCHSGGVIAPNVYHDWAQTRHATMFTRHIDGLDGGYPRESCITCHTVGYDANTNAVNGGFDDVAIEVGWTFPAVRTNGNWAAMPKKLQSVANIACENCHGPGSLHAIKALTDGAASKELISVTYNAGNCAQCHDSLTHHFRSAEWNHSRHAIATSYPTGPTRGGCVGCHSAYGFVDRMSGVSPLRTDYEAITCAACHDPHDATNPHQLRTVADVALMDNKTIVTEGGPAKLCMNCHMARRDAVTYVETSAGSSHFGPHYGCQTDMLMGVNAITYGKEIPSSAHREVVEELCVTCHMQENESTPSFTRAGGHSWNMKWDSGTNVFELTEACVQCHGETEEFNFKRQDFDGNGIVEGVQTEVHGLLNKLGRMLPPISDPAVNITSAYTKQQLRAAYNYKFVEEDGSFGVHNLAYAVGLLKESIADLSGDANNDGVPDWWQKAYFNDDINDPMARANANPSGDGMPNWLKLALGLDPRVPGAVVPDGVVFANGKTLGGQADKLHIYTAAEITFDTEVGKSYQIQGVSALGGGWQDIGTPIPGTGNAISYVTPTRQNVQQYYRVVIQ